MCFTLPTLPGALLAGRAEPSQTSSLEGIRSPPPKAGGTLLGTYWTKEHNFSSGCVQGSQPPALGCSSTLSSDDLWWRNFSQPVRGGGARSQAT